MKENTKQTTKLSTKEMVYIAICTALIAICSWISIPTVVPFTLQTFAVFAALEILGGKKGTISIVIYILLAAVGAPVLAGFKGGIGALLGMTGGYVLGFVFQGLTYWLFEHLLGEKHIWRVTAMVIGLFICYAFGTAWFMTVYAKQSGAIGLSTALSWCVLPFVVPDLVKMVLAILIAIRLRKVIVYNS